MVFSNSKSKISFIYCFAIYLVGLLVGLYLFSPSFISYAQLTDSLSTLNTNQVNLAISNITLGDSATGLTSVNGVILNNSTVDVENIQIGVALYDANNNTVQDTSRFVTAPFTVVEPNSTEAFEFLMLTENYHHYSANAYADIVE